MAEYVSEAIYIELWTLMLEKGGTVKDKQGKYSHAKSPLVLSGALNIGHRKYIGQPKFISNFEK